MRRLLRCGLALVLVMAALPTGDRTAHAADSILTEILRRGTVRIAIAVAAPPLRFEDENGNLQGYEIDIANRRYSARWYLKAPYDPERKKVLA